MKVFSRKKTAGSTSSTLQSNNGSSGQLLQRNGQPRSGEELDNSSVSSKRSLILRSIGMPKGLKRNKTNNTTKSSQGPNDTSQPNKGFSLKNAMQQEISRHRGARARNISPDITEEGSTSDSDGSSDEASLQSNNSWKMFGGCVAPDTLVEISSAESSASGESKDSSLEETREDRYACGAIEGYGRISVADSEDGSEDQLSVASPPIGTPGICGISDWLCATDYDYSQSDQKKGVDYRDEAAVLSEYQGQIDIYGIGKSPKSLKLRRYSKSPRPEMNDHILVKVEASTVSIQDYLERSSGYLEVPGRQVMGEVVSVGKKAKKSDNIQVGDRIVALTPNGNGNARFISIPAKSAIPIPSDVKRDDAICLVESYMSAYQMLNLGRTNGHPYTDANVLIIGGSNPVGQALVELALKEGANVTATAPESHREYLEKLGAIWFPEQPKKIYKLSGTMDLVVDTLFLDEYKSSYQALNSHGKLVCTTNPPIRDHGSIFARMGRSWFRFIDTFLPNISYYDVHKSFQDDPLNFEHEFRYLMVKLRNKEINPKISGRIALNQVPKAQTMVERGLPNGTVVVLPWEKLDMTQNIPVIHVRD